MNSTKLPVLLNQAACQLKLKNCKSARLCCEKALDIDENNVKVRLVQILIHTSIQAIFRRGQAWQGQGEYDKAKNDFLAAIKLDPKSKDLRAALENVKQQKQAYLEKQKKMYSGMF